MTKHLESIINRKLFNHRLLLLFVLPITTFAQHRIPYEYVKQETVLYPQWINGTTRDSAILLTKDFIKISKKKYKLVKESESDSLFTLQFSTNGSADSNNTLSFVFQHVLENQVEGDSIAEVHSFYLAEIKNGFFDDILNFWQKYVDPFATSELIQEHLKPGGRPPMRALGYSADESRLYKCYIFHAGMRFSIVVRDVPNNNDVPYWWGIEK